MSNRTLRVNELIQRELSDILRKRYQAEMVSVTVVDVHVAPNLRDGRVYVAVTGSSEDAVEKLKWLQKHARDIRFELGRRIVLKYMPQLTYVLDSSTARGNRILELLDGIDRTEGTSPKPEDEETN